MLCSLVPAASTIAQIMSATTRMITSRSSPATLRRNRPPIASERDKILALIHEDHELIRYLSDKASQRLNAATQALALVEERRIGLAEAEKRLETAASLHEFFVKNNKTPSVLDMGAPSTATASSTSTGQRHQYDSLMAIADTYIQSTRALVDQATLAMEEARDSVAIHRDELQAALTISMLHHDAQNLLKEQLDALKRSVIQKEAAFRAIWRVPGEIWRMIFEEVVKPDNDTELNLIDESWEGLKKDGCETLRLSGVCHNWRSLTHSTPTLWSQIQIPNSITPHHFDRIHHYYNLCSRSRLTITVLSPTARDARCFRPLHHLFYTGTPCKKIILLVRAPGVPALNTLLPSLPPPTELSILRHPHTGEYEEVERTPTPIIPRTFSGTIRTLDISAAGAQWLDETAMRVERYNIVAPPISAIFGPHRFIPSSLQSLTSLGIQGRLYDKEAASRRPLPNIKETVMDLNFLVTVFTRHYALPALQRLVIPAGSTVTQEEWQTFVTEVERTSGGINDVCCSSFDTDIDSLAKCLVSLRHLSRLELRGESVDPVLEAVMRRLEDDSAIFPCLKTLVIQSYTGDGDMVVSFLKMTSSSTPDGNVMEVTPRGPKPELALRGCQLMSMETRGMLRRLAVLIT